MALEKAKQALRRQQSHPDDAECAPPTATSALTTDRTAHAGSPFSININIGIAVNGGETQNLSHSAAITGGNFAAGGAGAGAGGVSNTINIGIPMIGVGGGTQGASHHVVNANHHANAQFSGGLLPDGGSGIAAVNNGALVDQNSGGSDAFDATGSEPFRVEIQDVRKFAPACIGQHDISCADQPSLAETSFRGSSHETKSGPAAYEPPHADAATDLIGGENGISNGGGGSINLADKLGGHIEWGAFEPRPLRDEVSIDPAPIIGQSDGLCADGPPYPADCLRTTDDGTSPAAAAFAPEVGEGEITITGGGGSISSLGSANLCEPFDLGSCAAASSAFVPGGEPLSPTPIREFSSGPSSCAADGPPPLPVAERSRGCDDGRSPGPGPRSAALAPGGPPVCGAENRGPSCGNQPMDDAPPQVMTLRDWIASERMRFLQRSDGRGCLEGWVRLAWEITKPVRDRHANDLTYGGALSSRSVKVSCLEPGVSFRCIDLGTAAVTSGQQATRSDLVSLGRVLYELFAGTDPYCDHDGEESVDVLSSAKSSLEELSVDERRPMKRRDPRQSGPAYTPLRDLCLPVSLCILVTGLLDARDDSAVDRYRSADEIEEDLRLMVANPDRYLYDTNNADAILSQLHGPSDKLYGRDKELSMMMGAFDRVICSGASCEVVLIKGFSGTGKSSLARQIQKPLLDKGGYFVSGKFDEMSLTQPLSAIVAAFNDYCNDLVTRGDHSLAEVKAEVESFVGSDAKVLVNLIPNLSKIIGGKDPSSVEVGCVEAMARLVFFFRMFARAISKPSRPVVLFLDDLQLADEASLEIIRMLATDREVSSLLVLGCYRDNEVGADHPLVAQQRKLMSSGVNVKTIHIESICKESVNSLISDSLHLAPRLTKELTKTIYCKTGGNTLFVVQFLISLFDEGVLHFSPMLRRWDWDLQAIRTKKIPDNVVDFLRKKMRTLCQDVQDVLRMAACLGAQSDESVLKLVGANNGHKRRTPELFEVAENEGIIYRSGSSYVFSHDQIQLAAYALTPEDKRDALHWEIGQRLIRMASEEDLEKILFIVVDQLNRGRALITDHREIIELAHLNLKAGKKAIASSSFLASSTYLQTGIELLKEEDWDLSYGLCLELYTCGAETEYTLGHFDKMKLALDNVLCHAKVFKDKLRAFYTLICSLGAQESLKEAIETGLEVLSQLGETFPKQIDKPAVVRDMMQTKSMLGDRSEDALSNLDVMTDETAVAAMKFLNRLSIYAYTGKQEFVPLIASRMVRLSLAQGVCKESAFGFASYGMVLCISAGNYSGGYRFGKVALKLLERLKANELLSRVYAIVYGCINIWKEPIQVCLPSHLEGYEVGLMTGDPECAMMNIHLFLSTGFFCGKPLAQLAKDCESYSKEMLEYKQEVPALMIQPMWQATLNLMGCTTDPLKLSGEAMDEEVFLWYVQEKGNLNAQCRLYLLRMWLAYLFGKYELAVTHMEKCQDFESKLLGLGLCFHTFSHGLVALALARKTQDKKWVDMANKAIEKFSTWAANAPWNCKHKLELLNAECAFFMGDTAKAAEAYDAAIELASNRSFVSDQALACERAAIFYSETGNLNSSAEHYAKAHQCYLKWGAQRKADDIEHLSRLD